MDITPFGEVKQHHTGEHQMVITCCNFCMKDVVTQRRENLALLVSEHGVSSVAKRMRRSPTQVSDMLHGRKSFGEKVARAMEKEWDASRPPGWLDLDPSYPEQAPPFDENVRPAVLPNERRIPLLNYVQAGAFADPGQNFTGEEMEYLLTTLPMSDRSFALEIRGDSMLPEFRPGDFVFIDCELSARPGDYVVAKNSKEEATFKKYRLLRIAENGHEIFELVPLNPDFPTMRSDEHHISIIGVMMEHRKIYRRS